MKKEGPLKTKAKQGLCYSKPTKCVKCSIVGEMTHPAGENLKLGGWTCARCGHIYRFAHWKIKKAGRVAKEDAA